MMILDVSVVMAWLMPDETMTQRRAIERAALTQVIHVPALWHLEVGNSLLVAQRRNTITAQGRSDILLTLSRLPVTTDALNRRRVWESSMLLADRHGLSLYDAVYLELAVRKNLPLATYDKGLARAAQVHQVLFTAQEET